MFFYLDSYSSCLLLYNSFVIKHRCIIKSNFSLGVIFLQKYLLVPADKSTVRGFDDEEDLKAYLVDQFQKDKSDFAVDEDLDIEDIDDLSVPTDGYYIYEIKDIINAISTSQTIDAGEKKEILKKLKKEEVKFNKDKFTDFDDILDEINEADVDF